MKKSNERYYVLMARLNKIAKIDKKNDKGDFLVTDMDLFKRCVKAYQKTTDELEGVPLPL